MKFFLILFLIAISFYSNAQTTFYKNFFNYWNSDGWYVDQTSDGGYILTGQTYAQGANSDTEQVVFVIKTDRGGNQTFHRTYAFGGPSLISQVPGGYLLIANGGTSSGGINFSKIDTFGNIIWMKNYDTSIAFDDGIYSTKTLEGGYLIQGAIHYAGSGYDSYGLILKTNSNGDSLWSKILPINNVPGQCSQTIDSGFIFAAADSFGHNIYHEMGSIKTDSHGNIIWNKNYGGTHCESGFSIGSNNIGTLLACNIFDSCPGFYNSYSPLIHLINLSIDGDTLWSKTISSSHGYVYGINACSNSDYILTGALNVNGSNSASLLFLSRIDINGNILWVRTFNSINASAGIFSKQTSDGGFIITGYDSADIHSGGGSRVVLIKTDGMGNTLFVKPIDNNYHSIQTYPNPTSELCTIHFNGFSPGNYHLQFCNTLGEQIMSKQISISSANQSELLSLQNYPPGFYYLQVQSGTEIECVKVVKE